MGSSIVILRGLARSCATIRSRKLSTKSRSSPWLIFPGAAEGASTVDTLYGVSDKKVLSLRRSTIGDSWYSGYRMVGSSHGWVALYMSEHLFMLNPLTGRRINLPRLLVPSLEKLIMSCCPDKEEEEEEEWLVVVSVGRSLSFCIPRRRNARWIHFGILNSGERYTDITYSTRMKLLTCVSSTQERGEMRISEWDLVGPRSPSEHNNYRRCLHSVLSRSTSTNTNTLLGHHVRRSCCSLNYLVNLEDSEHFLVVRQYVMERVNPNPIRCSRYKGCHAHFPCKTVGFLVYVVDRERIAIRTLMDGSSMDGLAIFVGLNHTFAMQTKDCPELNPNSIYFSNYHAALNPRIDHNYVNIGIFDCESGTITPCYYPSHYNPITRVCPAPMWFA